MAVFNLVIYCLKIENIHANARELPEKQTLERPKIILLYINLLRHYIIYSNIYLFIYSNIIII